MSDGNFNRQLLPKTDLSTGLRAGKAQMRTKAEHALKEILDEYFPNISPERRETICQAFMNKLRSWFSAVLRQKIEGLLVFVAKKGVCRNKNYGKHKHFLPIDAEPHIFAVSNKKDNASWEDLLKNSKYLE